MRLLLALGPIVVFAIAIRLIAAHLAKKVKRSGITPRLVVRGGWCVVLPDATLAARHAFVLTPPMPPHRVPSVPGGGRWHP